ncbi:MAG: hypothetical protein E5V16_09695 [Mesorhizobium sp.]|nr:MAG: hypothetical protein E5V16_09695 [Mesorhizobium sp.]
MAGGATELSKMAMTDMPFDAAYCPTGTVKASIGQDADDKQRVLRRRFAETVNTDASRAVDKHRVAEE